MAFNPFHAFRKHQRVLMAALVIFCMFIFVLQFGRGDPIERLMNLFGASRYGYRKGPLVTTLDGSKVYEGELYGLARQRRLASDFLAVAAQQGGQLHVAALADKQSKEGARPEDDISRVVGLWAMMLNPRPNNPFNSPQFRAQQAGPDLARVLAERHRLLDQGKLDEARNVDQLARVLAFEAWVWSQPANSREFYFGGSPKTEDLLDFLVWKEQADRLGIVLTEEDVAKLVNHEAAGVPVVPDTADFASKQNQLVYGFLAQRGGQGPREATPSALLDALTQEFRVAMAQEAVLGQAGGVGAFRGSADGLGQIPADPTPREFLDYYRKSRTTLRVAMLPVAVDAFLPHVEGRPSEETLRALFNRYHSQEPAPDRDQPGFKEPRRVRVEAVAGRADDPYYKDLAKATLLAASLTRVLAPAGGGAGGGGAAAALEAAYPFAYDPYAEEYRVYQGGAEQLLRTAYGTSVDPAARKFLTAGAVGAAAAGPAAALAALAGAEQSDVRAAAGAASASVLAGSGPPLGAPALPMLYTAAVLSPEAAGPLLAEKAEKSLAPRLLARNLRAVGEELAKVRGQPDKARALIERLVKEDHLRHWQMAQPRSVNDLEKDPALKELVEAYGPQPREIGLTQMLTFGRGTYEAGQFPFSGDWDKATEPFLFWRTEDLPSRERTFEQARDDVERAWRTEQARALARQKAEQIDAEVRANVARNGSAAEAVAVLRGHGDVFELDRVARLLPVDEANPSGLRRYAPFVPPPDKIPYPRPDFADRLLALEKPGDSMVLRDKPASNFYVAVLLERNDPAMARGADGKAKLDLKGFLDVYRDTPEHDSLWQQHLLPERRRDYRQALLRQMRAEATGGKVDDQGNYILPDNVMRTAESSASDSGE
jgi:hypothetical protein